MAMSLTSYGYTTQPRETHFDGSSQNSFTSGSARRSPLLNDLLELVRPDLYRHLYGVADILTRALTSADDVEYEATKTTEPVDLSWYFSVVQEGVDAQPDAARLAVTIQGVSQLVKNGLRDEFDRLDNLLSQTECNSMSDASAVALVRASYPFRSKLSQWRPFAQRTANTLRERGSDPERLLKGAI